jgi:hypothetical protein
MEKVDMQIISIAVAHRAEQLYTLEVEQFSRWADGRIQIAGLPQEQRKLQFPD